MLINSYFLRQSANRDNLRQCPELWKESGLVCAIGVSSANKRSQEKTVLTDNKQCRTRIKSLINRPSQHSGRGSKLNRPLGVLTSTFIDVGNQPTQSLLTPISPFRVLAFTDQSGSPLSPPRKPPMLLDTPPPISLKIKRKKRS